MNDWELDLMPRWENIRVGCISKGWHSPGSPLVSQLASAAQKSWFDSRRGDRVEDFINQNGREMLAQRGFGKGKYLRLVEILEAALDITFEKLPSATPDECLINYLKALDAWNVPLDYPIKLLPASARVRHFCHEREVTGLRGLMELWSILGREGLMAQENIGRRTVNELQEFADALADRDCERARGWLPINDAENGLCLKRSLYIRYEQLSDPIVMMLTRRLVDKLSLEDSAGEINVTRERVRQCEMHFLRDIREVLDWFSLERDAMLSLWTERTPWEFYVLPQVSQDAANLILGAIDSIFSNTSQGVARRLSTELEAARLLDGLIKHPDFYVGGVDLQLYMDEKVPVTRQNGFLEELTDHKLIIVDSETGIARPRTQSVAETISAILSQESEPIPLTWLILRVRMITGQDVDPELVFRNRYRWSSNGRFDIKAVIWKE